MFAFSWGRLARLAVLGLIALVWVVLDRTTFVGTGAERRYLGEHGWLSEMEDRALDWMFLFRGERDAPVQVIYVDIDSESISALGNLPWDRAWYADVAGAVTEVGGARAVGIDIVFSEQGQPLLFRELLMPGNARMAQLLDSNRRIVLGASYSAQEFRRSDGTIGYRRIPMRMFGLPPREKIEPPEMPELVMPPRPGLEGGWTYFPQGMGLIDALNNDVRWIPVYTPPSHGFDQFFALSLELVLRYLDVERGNVGVFDDRVEVRGAGGELALTIPLTREQLLQVNWFSAWGSDKNPRIDFATVWQYAQFLREEATEEEKTAAFEFFEQFRGSVVLIGPVDPLLQDLAPTPFDPTPVPKVGMHGNLVKTMLSGDFIVHPPGWVKVALILGVSAAVTSLTTFGSAHSWRPRLLGLALVVAYVTAAFQLFDRYSFHLPLVGPMGAAFSTSFVAAVLQLVTEQRQKSRIKNMFGTYVSPELVNRMVESRDDPRLGGSDVEITAYFSDIQSFSSISEILPPAQLVELMNEYLTACTDIVTEESGTLDKYIGDAVVAMFGAPVHLANHARRACCAAIRVQKRQAELRAKWAADPRGWHPRVLSMRTRIGLNSGRCVVGNMGSKSRFNYTMMGDNVNIAARMESGAKYFGVYTLVTGATKAAAEVEGPGLVFRYLDKIEVVGRGEPLLVYELIGWEEELEPSQRTALERFAEGRKLYDAREWDRAEALFREAAAVEIHQPGRDPGVHNNPSLAFAARCAAYRADPPEADWDGVHRLKEK